MPRVIGLTITALFLVAGCSSDGDADDSSADATPATDAASTAEGGSDEGATPETTVVLNPQTSATVQTPFSIPPLDTDEIDVMIDEAFEDDQLDADEIEAILAAAGMEPSAAACEAELLVELGVEEVNGGQELLDAVQAMTPEQRARLDDCLAG